MFEKILKSGLTKNSTNSKQIQIFHSKIDLAKLKPVSKLCHNINFVSPEKAKK